MAEPGSDILADITAAEEGNNFNGLEKLGREIAGRLEKEPHLAPLVTRLSEGMFSRAKNLYDKGTANKFAARAAAVHPAAIGAWSRQAQALQPDMQWLLFDASQHEKSPKLQAEVIRLWDTNMDAGKDADGRLHLIESGLSSGELGPPRVGKPLMEHMLSRWSREFSGLSEARKIEHALWVLGEDEWGNDNESRKFYPVALRGLLGVISERRMDADTALPAIDVALATIGAGQPLEADYMKEWSHYVGLLPAPAGQIEKAVEVLTRHRIHHEVRNAPARGIILDNLSALSAEERLKPVVGRLGLIQLSLESMDQNAGGALPDTPAVRERFVAAWLDAINAVPDAMQKRILDQDMWHRWDERITAFIDENRQVPKPAQTRVMPDAAAVKEFVGLT